MRHIPPCAAVIYKVQYRIYQFLFLPFATVSCTGKQWLYDCLPAVTQIASISASLSFRYHALTLSFPFYWYSV